MRKVMVFNQVTVDGYIAGKGGDISWARTQDPEWDEFVEGNATGEGGVLLFGRKTYDLMASFWPTPQAMASMPVVAQRMNDSKKVVFSRTMEEATWKNTTLVKGDLQKEVKTMKEEGEDDLVIFGSGSITSQLTHAGLIDEYPIVVHPVALGAGKTMFEGIPHRLKLRLTKSRVFGNGNVWLCYDAMR